MIWYLLMLTHASALDQKCETISIPMCKSIQYNYTFMPNSFNHESQDEAGLEVHQYWPLVEIKCSEDLKFFICSLYVPICMEDYVGTVPPCKSVCERARAGCEPVMTQYGFSWPERMDCKQFPPYGKNSICMDERNGEMPSYAVNTCKQTCNCNSPLIKVSSNVTTGKVDNCGFPCRGYGYDSDEQKRFVSYWLIFWSGSCAFLCTITILTFILDSSRFNYPERPIICISFCYVFVSIGYLLSSYNGHEQTSCTGPQVRYPGDRNVVCGAVFSLIYYFSVASSFWYVVLCFTWYLASVLKWGTEAISEKYWIFHWFVWGSSGLLTSYILYNSLYDGDSISGICFVGNQSNTNLLTFVLIPFGSLLLISKFFFIHGFIALIKIRNVIVREVRNIHKLEKLMIRIGVFGILYTINVFTVLFSYAYEAYVRDVWVNNVNCHGCRQPFHQNTKPSFSLLMIKYFMMLAIGLTSSIWVFSSKTIQTWKSYLCKTSNKKTSV